MNDSSGSLEMLSTRVDELERRICALEHPAVAQADLIPIRSQPPGRAEPVPTSMQAGIFFPTLGKAMLGIAGAYVLRAIAEAGAVPRFAISAVAVAYAFGWLIWASRIALPLLPRVVYASTSALILAPMLWEDAVHFHSFRPVLSASILAAFAMLSMILEFRFAAHRISWIGFGTAAFMNVALALATHELLPFTSSLLVALLASSCGRMFGFISGARLLIAVVADVAVWGFIFIYSGPAASRAEYRPLPLLFLIAPGCMLFLVQGTSVAVSAIFHREEISIFDAVQTVLAFVLAMWTALAFLPSGAATIAGAACLGLAAAVYAASYLRLRFLRKQRNFRIFESWAAALLVTGTTLALSRELAAICLAIGALLAYLIAGHVKSQMLELQGAFFLLAASLLAKLPQYLFGALCGAMPDRASFSFLAVLVCSALIELAVRDRIRSNWKQGILRFVPLAVAASTLCAAIVHGVVFISSTSQISAHHLALLRTAAISGVTLCAAIAGAGANHGLEKRLAYGSLVFLAAKLLFEDLRTGHMEFAAASVFILALTLMAVPRILGRVRVMNRAKAVK